MRNAVCKTADHAQKSFGTNIAVSALYRYSKANVFQNRKGDKIMKNRFKKISVAILLAAVIVIAVPLALWLINTSDSGTASPMPPITMDMTQMPLYVEGDTTGIVPLGWQAIFEVPRNGFVLMPQAFGQTGVNIDSAFVLTPPPDTPDGFSPTISIDGQPLPAVMPLDDGTFLVVPAMPLLHNNLHTFRLAMQNGDITWAFQTAVRFAVVSTLPAHQAVNVPVNTGIEIDFSVSGHTDIREFFSISPAVEGRFIQRGTLTVFMPTNPLAAGQVYTVTISAGIGLPYSDEVLTDDIVFAFETANEGVAQQNHNRDSIQFGTNYVEFPSFEPPSISFWLSYRNSRPAVTFDMLRFDDDERAIAAVESLTNNHFWAWWSWQNRHVDTTGLAHVTSHTITQPTNSQWGWMESLTLPDALPPGFYIVNASIGGELNDQVVIQITDIAVHTFADNEMTILWVNDMITGQPAQNARVAGGGIANTNYNGIAILDSGMSDNVLVVTTADGRRCVIFTPSHLTTQHFWRGFTPMGTHNADYWSVLRLDRTLYQRSDVLYFWGFAQSRNNPAQNAVNHVTVTITDAWHWNPFMGGGNTIYRAAVPVQNGAYNGSINLPHLDPGFYNLIIQHGDVILGTAFFDVRDYVTPPYRLSVTADRAAAFVGESIVFTTRTEFFEGTPVPDLSFRYGIWGWQTAHSVWGQHGQTGLDGEFSRTIQRIAAETDAQGEGSLTFSAEAQLPEIGDTFASANVRVFVNDIDVDVRASREGADATLTINVNTITLDRINNGTADGWSDFLDEPVAGQTLQVSVTRVYWVPVRIGERYCFIERIVVPRYRYDRREEVIETFNLTTGADGTADRNFTVPNRPQESYFVRVTTNDGNGRQIRHDAFVGRDWWNFWSMSESGEPFLYTGLAWDDGVDIGDTVNLEIRSGNDAIERGGFLFVIASNGIIQHFVGTNSVSFNFEERHLPNATVYAVYFNGHTYHTGWNMRQNLRFNSASREMTLDITTDRNSYRPGDIVNVTVRATDRQGNPMAAIVNIAAVDEALLALQGFDPNTDILSNLYRNVPSGVLVNISTHQTFVSAGGLDIDDVEEMRDMLGLTTSQSLAADAFSVNANAMPYATRGAAMEVAMDASYGGGGTGHVRDNFLDTAVFAMLHTDTNGVATFSFRLPHNITSWRLSASGINSNLYAGNSTSDVIVTLPMFVHYSLNSVFLTGDNPTIGVNAYGTALSHGDRIVFEVWDEANPTDILRAEGYAFARVNIPLWDNITAAEGGRSIIIRASANGMTDAVRHDFYVIASHRTIDVPVFYDVAVGTTFASGGPGLTQITFTDQGRGQFLNELLGMRWSGRGSRLEGYVMRREANRLLGLYFPDIALFNSGDSFNPAIFQQTDGGIAIVPHGASNLGATVRMMPFVVDEINTHTLANYLYNVLHNQNQLSRARALYGLAMLGEPVLLYLHAYAAAENLSVQDMAYIALGFAALGETHTAAALYAQHIQPYIQRIAPYYRIEMGNRTQTLETTSVAALLASQLQMPERIGLHQYTVRHHNMEWLIGMHRLSFIVNEIANVEQADADVTYTLFGEEITQDLSGGRSFTLRIPAQNLAGFSITGVTGDVGAVSIHRVPLEDIEPIEAGITLERRFFRAGEATPRTAFNQGDLVRVEIRIDYSRNASSGSYKITDFLPAGLVLAPNSTRFADRDITPGQWRFATAEGQRVMFFDHNSSFNRTRVYYYYARVINPGTFRAQGLIVQSMAAREYMVIGEDDVITILP